MKLNEPKNVSFRIHNGTPPFRILIGTKSEEFNTVLNLIFTLKKIPNSPTRKPFDFLSPSNNRHVDDVNANRFYEVKA